MLGGFKLVDEVLDVYGVDTKIVEQLWRRPQNNPKWTKIKQKSLVIALIYSRFSTTAYPQRISLFNIIGTFVQVRI